MKESSGPTRRYCKSQTPSNHCWSHTFPGIHLRKLRPSKHSRMRSYPVAQFKKMPSLRHWLAQWMLKHRKQADRRASPVSWSCSSSLIFRWSWSMSLVRRSARKLTRLGQCFYSKSSSLMARCTTKGLMSLWMSWGSSRRKWSELKRHCPEHCSCILIIKMKLF